MTSKTAYLFPGQGSQSVGMGLELANAYPAARQLFEQADRQLGFSLSELAWNGPEEELNDTINTQPALFVHSIASWKIYRDLKPAGDPDMIAGHSMGELSALVAAGALPFEAGLALVRRRGELMKMAGEQNPGGMAAILGLDIPTLDGICAQASTPEEIIQVANDNCPGQCVISGASPALERAMELAKEAGARRVVPLTVSIAAHSPLMAAAQEKFTEAVLQAPITDPAVPVVGNVTAAPMTSADEIRSDLVAQLRSRVRWTETIEYMHRQGIEAVVELGNGEVLSGLVKRIDRSLVRLHFGSPEDLSSVN
ncbi:MAG: ACP S-malonyltransferase [Anaerolineales bacterium]|nr:ACP S-malonyltransferase [Anaerolineales bacterium]